MFEIPVYSRPLKGRKGSVPSENTHKQETNKYDYQQQKT